MRRVTRLIKNNIIKNNCNGGISCYGNSSPIITGNIISENMAFVPGGGGIFCGDDSSPIILLNIISNNRSLEHGGGILCIGNSSAKIINNIIIDNITVYGDWPSTGGAGIFSNSNCYISNNIIKNNIGEHSPGGGIYCAEKCSSIVVNNTITSNSLGIFCAAGSNPIIFNCIISFNTGSGVFSQLSFSNISYCNIYENQNGNFNGCGDWVGKNAIVNANGDSCDLYHNIQLDPLFKNIEGEDFHLSNESPCIGAGILNEDVPVTDFDGNPRPNPPDTNPDIGAYENEWDHPVPVELSNFRASFTNGKVKLQWITLSETNNIGFEIERSTNCSNFIRIGFVKGYGTTNRPIEYVFVDNTCKSDHYFYRLRQIDSDGTFTYSEKIEIEIPIPQQFILYQNYPNPFNSTTTIPFKLPEKMGLKLILINTLGHEIQVLTNGTYKAGHHEIKFDASELSSGIYFYKLVAGEFIDTKKLLIAK